VKRMGILDFGFWIEALLLRLIVFSH